jgi:hypothetical protein
VELPAVRLPAACFAGFAATRAGYCRIPDAEPPSEYGAVPARTPPVNSSLAASG